MFRSLAIVLILSSVGCATIMKENLEPFAIETTPAGAKVTMGEQTCHTPCNLDMERKRDYVVNIEKPGFESQTHEVNGSSWDPWLLGNLVFLYGFPVGVGIDFYTGKAYDFSPAYIKTDLKEASSKK